MPLSPPRQVNAGNAGGFTLDGTRTFLVGTTRVAVIDPGPDVEDHVRAVASLARSAECVTLVLTHGHADHAAAAPALAAALGAEVAGAEGLAAVTRPLRDGDVVMTDQGELHAVHTPGHTREHLCFHWPERRALFAGDLLLGRGDTTWVAEYPGCIADYLASLKRLQELDLEVIFPGHGPPLTDPTEALDRFARHRRTRIRQVEAALNGEPDADADRLLDLVYGDSVPPGLRGAAMKSLEAVLDHVRRL